MANISSINGNPIVPSNGSVGTAQVASGYNLMTDAEKSKLSLVDSLVERVAEIQVQQGGGAPVDLVGYLKSADAEATYAPKSQVSALRTRMDDAESSIAELAKRLPIYYYTDVPSESSITEKPQLAVIKGGAVYLVE